MTEQLIQLLFWYAAVLLVDVAQLRHHLLQILELVLNLGHLAPYTGGQLVNQHGGLRCDEPALADDADERARGCGGALHNSVDGHTTGLNGIHGRAGSEHGSTERANVEVDGHVADAVANAENQTVLFSLAQMANQIKHGVAGDFSVEVDVVAFADDLAVLLGLGLFISVIVLWSGLDRLQAESTWVSFGHPWLDMVGSV